MKNFSTLALFPAVPFSHPSLPPFREWSHFPAATAEVVRSKGKGGGGGKGSFGARGERGGFAKGGRFLPLPRVLRRKRPFGGRGYVRSREEGVVGSERRNMFLYERT